MRSSKSRSRNKSNRQRSLGNIVNRVFDSSGPEGKVRGTPQQIIEKYLTLARDAQLSNDRVAEQSFLQHAEHYTRMLGEAQREMAERQQQHGSGPRQNGEDENGQRDQGARDQNWRDQNWRDQAGRDQGGRDQAGRDQGGRDQGGRDLRDQGGRDQGGRTETGAEPQRRAEPSAREMAPEDGQGDASMPDAAISASEDVPGLPDAVAAADEDLAAPVETPETKAPRARNPRPRTPRSATGRSRRKPAADDSGEGGPQPEPHPAGNGDELG